MSAQDNAAIAQKGYDAYNRHASDPKWLETATEDVTEDCEVIDVPSGTTSRGPEGLKQFLLRFSTAFPDSTIEVTNLVATENAITGEFTGHGTHTGPLHSPAGDIPPTGRSLTLHFCEVYTLKDSKITSHRTYYDLLGMLQQLGVIPASEQAG